MDASLRLPLYLSRFPASGKMEDFEGKENCIEIQKESQGSIHDSKWEKRDRRWFLVKSFYALNVAYLIECCVTLGMFIITHLLL